MAQMHFSWAMDLDPKGANSQIKDALDPTLNRTQQENDSLLEPNHNEEPMQVQPNDDDDDEGEEFQDISESFNPPEGGASTSQESLDPSVQVTPPSNIIVDVDESL